MKKYCIKCAREKHTFESKYLESTVFIDDKIFISLHRSPSHKVKCSDCGIKTNEIFEPLYPCKKERNNQ